MASPPRVRRQCSRPSQGSGPPGYRAPNYKLFFRHLFCVFQHIRDGADDVVIAFFGDVAQDGGDFHRIAVLPGQAWRIRAQKDESFYKNHADIIIKNYPPYNLDDEVKKVLLWAKL